MWNKEWGENDGQAITLDMCKSFWNEHLRPFRLARLVFCSCWSPQLRAQGGPSQEGREADFGETN